MNMKASQLEWGLRREDIEAPALWGARAIYRGGIVDLLYDRQSVVATDDDARGKLIATINAVGPHSIPPKLPLAATASRAARTPKKIKGSAVKAFMEWARDRFWGGDVRVESVVFGGVEFTASTNASHGYLYITARVKPE